MARHETLHAIGMLARLRLRRMINIIRAGGMMRRRAADPTRRQAAKRRGSGDKLLMLFAFAAMGFGFGYQMRLALFFLYCRSHTCGVSVQMLHAHAAAVMHTSPFDEGMLHGLALWILLLLMLSTLYPFLLAARTQPEWDFEWLSTLPVSRNTLLYARVGERAAVNPTLWFACGIPAALIAWYANAGWLTPLEVVLVLAPLSLLCGAGWVLLDLGFHIVLKPGGIRNLQAVLGLVLLPILLLISWQGQPVGRHIMATLIDGTPDWIRWTPPGLAAQLLGRVPTIGSPALYGLLWVETLVVVALCVAVLRYQLRAGVSSHGTRESGRSKRRVVQARMEASTSGRFGVSPVKRRECLLLLRDRRYLMQSMIAPLVVIGSQFAMHGRFATSIRLFTESPGLVAASAFAMGAYSLMTAALNALIAEEEQIWMLYTFPRPIMSVLAEKAQFYGFLGLPYALLIFGAGAIAGHFSLGQMAFYLALILIGMAIYSFIAVAISVQAGLLSGTGGQLRRAAFVYLFMLFASFYTYALGTGDWWSKLVLPVLCLALSYALWQKSCDRQAWLLDPTAAPPSRVTLAGGILAVIGFFLVQFLCLWLAIGKLHVDHAVGIVIAYVGAGAVTYLIVRIVYRVAGTLDVPAIVGPQAGKSVAMGAGVGLLCAAFGLAYLWVSQHYGWVPAQKSHQAITLELRGAVAGLAVLAAPVFEEFLFRGLIFGGLRRTLNLPISMLGSAVLFAIVHPPYAMLPVFVLGLGTAFVYSRQRMLLASMATHAVYNAVVVGCALFVTYGAS